jgi:hypothetical protein
VLRSWPSWPCGSGHSSPSSSHATRWPIAEAVIRALQRGYTEALVDPESAVTALLDQVEGLDRTRVTAELDAIAPGLTAGAPAYGALPRRGPGFDTTLVGPVSRE